MTDLPLWTVGEIVAATEGRSAAPAQTAITGVSIDNRTLTPGELFVAIKGDVHDGHAFVEKALAAGAAAALVAETYPGADPRLIRVPPAPGDAVLEGMRRIGIAARARLAPTARVIGVTGSVGKTGTKEALRAVLSTAGKTHAPEKSFNNHWGVPLTLARMPRDTDFCVAEIGMSAPGEITPLTRMVRPHVAIITTVAPVHLEFFASEAGIADAKAEIFDGLEPGGTAVLNRDNPHFERLAAAARAVGAQIVPFGAHAGAEVRLLAANADHLGSDVTADLHGRTIHYRLGTPGQHVVQNSLAVAAALSAAGVDPERAMAALAGVTAGEGRGDRTEFALPGGAVLLIDECFNANPASMRAALAALADIPRGKFRRRIAVLGDMRELGERSAELHNDLLQPVTTAGVDLLVTVGPYMAGLHQRTPEVNRGPHADASEALTERLLGLVRPGDVVMIKGSKGTRMAPLVTAMKSHLASAAGNPHKG